MIQTILNHRFFATLSLLLYASLSGCDITPTAKLVSISGPVAPIINGPIAIANTNYKIIPLNTAVQLSAAKSSHTKNQSLRYLWTLIKKPINSQLQWGSIEKTPLFTADVVGEYTIELVTYDDSKRYSKPFNIILTTHKTARKPINFVALGDMGTGKQAQYDVANAIASVCQQQQCDFAIGLGDNIYNAGARSVDDDQFIEKFEKPYQSLDMPFYMVLGNHDNSGLFAGDGGFNYRGNIEVLYTTKPNKPSQKWQMPSRYYTFSTPKKFPIIDFLALDSSALTSLHDPTPHFALRRIMQQQGEWIKNTLLGSQGQWKIAFAHHPYISNGRHGNAGQYDRVHILPDNYFLKRIAGGYYKEFVEQYLCNKVDIIIAGHDHNLQLLEPNSRCTKTHFIVSGAGAKTTALGPTYNKAYWQTQSLGFFWLSATSDTIIIHAYTVNDNHHTLAFRHLISRNAH